MKRHQAVDGQGYSHLEMIRKKWAIKYWFLKVRRQQKKKQEVESMGQPHSEHGIEGNK